MQTNQRSEPAAPDPVVQVGRRGWRGARAVFLAASLPGIAVLAFAGGSELTRDEGTNHFARAPYVQMATPTSMVVAWRTDREINPLVKWGRSVATLDQRTEAGAVVVRVALTTNKTELKKMEEAKPELFRLPKLHSAPAGLFQYEARITGLSPDTRYYYAVYDDDRRLTQADESYHFVTHPPVGTSRPARFWIVGDSGTAREPQHTVQTAMWNWTAHEKHPIDFYLHLGDMAYSRGRDPEFQTRFFEVYEPTLRNKVCWPTMGNHEGATSKGTNGVGPYYDAYVVPTRAEAGGLASGTEAYYSFDYGRVHFICLDSHDLDRKPTGMMARWLKMDMERTKADWLIAFFHHPPYTKGSHDSDREKQLIEMRTHIVPVLESGGVDVVLSGHSHIYERSMLMDGAYETPTVAENVILDDRDGNPKGEGPYRKSAGIHPNAGTVQIVAGHGGTSNSRKGTMPVMKSIWVEHGSVIMDVDGDTLHGVMINKFGDLRDEFSIVKRGTVVNQRLANPRQPDPWVKTKAPGDEDFSSEPPEDYFVAIPKHSEWSYLAGDHPDGTKWTELKFDDKKWRKSQAPFGYGYREARTVLDDMKGKYTALYLRHEFHVEQADFIADLGLMINFDDGFIAYLNGKEVVRKGVAKGHGKGAQQVKSHDANKYNYFPLKEFEKHLRDGVNVLCIEGHNQGLGSEDFLIDPYLLIED